MELDKKIDFSHDYVVKYRNELLKDKWKVFLFEEFKGVLRNRFEELISSSECLNFFKGLKYEYGFGVEKDLNKALEIYINSSGCDSLDYLSMARLFELYKNQEKKFKIKKDKNLEIIYLLKSFIYCPISVLKERYEKDRFPIDLAYTIASFLDNNDPKLEIYHYI